MRLLRSGTSWCFFHVARLEGRAFVAKWGPPADVRPAKIEPARAHAASLAANFGRLGLGCVEADVSEYMLILLHFEDLQYSHTFLFGIPTCARLTFAKIIRLYCLVVVSSFFPGVSGFEAPET